jgi:hypothetical protein
MRRFIVSLSPTLVVLLSLTATMSRSSVAQEATPDALAAMMATNPVAGTWTWVNGEGADAFPSIATFHPDGSYMEVLPWGAVFMGVWQPTGERTATVTQVLNALDPTEEGEKLMQAQGRATVEVDESGNTMIWEGLIVGRYQDESIAFEFDLETSIGTRLLPQPMATLEELKATPVPLGAATPTAGTLAP